MNEQLISFETAKLAKEKGFKLGSGWQIRSLFNIKDGKTFCEKTIETPEYACERCTQSLLQKWLREKHKIVLIVGYQYEHDSTPYSYWIYKENNSLPLNQWINDLKTYEEALELGLIEALKLI